MNKQLFWKIHKVINRIRFLLMSKVFKIDERHSREKIYFSSTLLIIWKLVKRILLCVLIILPIIYLNNIIEKQYEIINDNQIKQYILDFLYAGLGIVGVILGLYCANISSIYTATYTNAPLNLSQLFASDIITNKNIDQITGYIVFALLLILGLLIDLFSPGIVLILSLIFATIYIIIAFSVNGNRSLYLSNTFIISKLVYFRTNNVFDKLSSKKIYKSEKSIQNHLKKVSTKELDNLREVANYNMNIPSSQNAYMRDFICSNLELLTKYLRVKLNIPKASFWFEEKEIYKQWHNASYAELETAINSGTMIRNENTRNYYWFEENILSTNKSCIEKFAKEKSYDCIYTYVLNLSKLSKTFIENNIVDIYVEHIISIFDLLKKELHEDETVKKDDSVTGLFELLIICYLDICINFRCFINDIDLEEINKTFIKDVSKSHRHKKYILVFNDPKLQKLEKCIKTEIKIEKRRLTAEWYINQLISEAIYNFCGDVIFPLHKMVIYIIDQINYLQENEYNEAACLMLSKVSEIKSKNDYLTEDISNLLETLKAKHVDKTTIWKEIQFENYKNKIIDLYYSHSKQFKEVAIKATVGKWSNRNSMPDYLGHCFNVNCTILIDSISQNNFERFKANYDGFLRLMLFYQEYIRQDLIKKKEPYLQQGLLNSFVQPMLDYSIISGLAILAGEFSENMTWKNYINEKLENSIKADENFKKTIESWITLLMETRNVLFYGIGNRGILHSSWEIQIKKSIVNNYNVEYEIGEFGNSKILTNSKIINNFCYSSYHLDSFEIDFHNPEELFCVICLNKYVSTDKKYKSSYEWEKNIYDENTND